jgi:hypothetical protein
MCEAILCGGHVEGCEQPLGNWVNHKMYNTHKSLMATAGAGGLFTSSEIGGFED